MTDNEIIKALECCSTATCFTNKCPYEEIYDIPKCTTKLTQDALDLINRQNEEIESDKYYYNECLKELAKAKVEIERLEGLANHHRNLINYLNKVADVRDTIKKVSAEMVGADNGNTEKDN